LTDYIFQLTPEEQRKVASSMPRAKTASVHPSTDHTQAAAQPHQAANGGSR